jgi:hypothetical protein
LTLPSRKAFNKISCKPIAFPQDSALREGC